MGCVIGKENGMIQHRDERSSGCEKPNERESVFMNPLQETLVMHVVFFFFLPLANN